MTINVLDTAAGMEAVLSAAETQRTDLLATMLAPMEGMYRYFPGPVDLVAMHGMSFGFPVDRDIDRCCEALERLKAADAWNRMDHALAEAVAVQVRAIPGLAVPDLTVLLVLGDPAEDYFRGPARGLSGNGSATGFISLTLWPTEENLDRLEAAVVHELNHNLRYAPGGVFWDPAAVTVGEQVVSEGLADAFARQLYGDRLGYTPMGALHLRNDAVFSKVVSGLQVGGMQNFTAWVHGDEAATRFGAEPVGLPAGAGYAAGNRLVNSYLRQTGLSAAEALHAPSRDIIEVALKER